MTLEELQEKIKQNPGSPLFARLAGEMFDRGYISQAREVCLAGLKHHPTYQTGYFILAKTYAAEGDFTAAAKSIKNALHYFPDSPMLQELYQNWSKRVDENTVEVAAQPPVILPTIQQGERLPDDWRIMSKSLAEVYAAQSLFKEAIQTYEGLKMLKPSQRNEWEERIGQLREMMVKSKTKQP